MRARGHDPSDVVPVGAALVVRRTAHLHTSGTIDDVTDSLPPDLVGAVVRGPAHPS